MKTILKDQPTPGDWSHIENLLRQLTKEYPEESYHYYEMLLDWITLAYFKPEQKLPIILLVSRDHCTGKTSFLNLLKYIFGDKSIIGDEDIIERISSVVFDKELVGIDAYCVGQDPCVAESLKYLNKAYQFDVTKKGQESKTIRNCTHFVLCANEVCEHLFLPKDEVRFWVILTTQVLESDPEFCDAIEKEVPAFLSYLQQRSVEGKMFVKEREHRMWFAPERIYNEDLTKMMSLRKYRLQKSNHRIKLPHDFLTCKELKNYILSIANLIPDTDEEFDCFSISGNPKVSKDVPETSKIKAQMGELSVYIEVQRS